MDDLLRHDRGTAGRPTSRDDRVREDIAALDGMDLAELRATWKRLYRSEAPRFFRRDLLSRAIAYKIQEKAFGGLSPKPRRRLLKIAAEAEARTFTTAGAPRHLRPGTRLVRSYGGTTHTVEVLNDGDFVWNGKKFRSLSGISTAITGTRWNGNVFFGLKGATAAAKSEEGDE